MPNTKFSDALNKGITPSQRRNKALQHVSEVVANGRPSYHSASGTTICAVLHHLETIGKPYTLIANPGKGYEIRAYDSLEAMLTATSK